MRAVLIVMMVTGLISCALESGPAKEQKAVEIDSLQSLVDDLQIKLKKEQSESRNLRHEVHASKEAVKGVKELEAHYDHLRWVEFLSEGPRDWSGESEDSKAYRVSITLSEIYRSIYIEAVEYGGEGCCKKIVQRIRLDLYTDLGISGERTSGIVFRSWESPNEFTFACHDDMYRVIINDLEHIEYKKL